ncbi:MAG: ParA family protein [Nitrospirae bacterium]|nr:ParA family protein [Nitrospirota bacterium]
MARIIAVANQKGGVGKTTTSINLSASLAMAEHPVLLIDLDPQANATSGVGLGTENSSASLYDCLLRGIPAKEAIRSTLVSQLSVLPSSPDLAGAEIELVPLDERESALKRVIDGLRHDFDYIIIDCPPALGLLTINALVAASSVLVPVQCEYYAMEGLGRLMSNIARVQGSLNQELELEGILLTMYDSRNSLSRQVAEEIRSHFKDKVYQSVIPRNVALAEAPSYGRPILLYNAASTGCQAYVELAKEFLSHGEKSAGKRA